MVCLYTCTTNIDTYSLTSSDPLNRRFNHDMTFNGFNLHASLLSGLVYTLYIPMYIHVKLTAGAGWDGGRATSPPVHEADGLAAQLRPSLVCQKKGEMVGTPFHSKRDECICTAVLGHGCWPKKKSKNSAEKLILFFKITQNLSYVKFFPLKKCSYARPLRNQSPHNFIIPFCHTSAYLT